MTPTLAFTVPVEEEGQRADRALSARLPELSRARIQKAIEDGCFLLNGRAAKASTRLRAGDQAELVIPPEQPLDLVPQDIPLQILFEDEFCLVLNKPAGLTVHPGAGQQDGTLANALVHHFGRLPGSDPLRPGIIHRLDKDTSGLLLVTRTEEARNRFTRLFTEREIYKEYTALVHGSMEGLHGLIDEPIGRHPVHRLKFATGVPRSRPCRTEWFVEQSYPGFTLLRVVLHTGRTHQIRVHLSSLRHPIAGDALYGAPRPQAMPAGDLRQALSHLGRFFLHARRLRFRHPFTGLDMALEAPLPQELVRILDLLG